MVELSVGQASGMIAIGVFILQVGFALMIPMILVAFLTEANTVSTWSVLGRLLHSSRWPTILRADTAASDGVRRGVVVSEWTQTGILALVTIASIVTPFGLYNVIAPESSPAPEAFAYLRDTSAFGYGTPPRSNSPFLRVCGTDAPCPGQILDEQCNAAGNNCTVSYDPRVPPTLRDLFNDGAQQISPTVSGPFDIQWRSYSNWTDPFSDIGWFQRQSFRELSNLILDDEIQPVEGLIVDMVSGGIGFRNHTGPVKSLHYGMTWEEDILFIEPETECVNLNISIDFEMTTDITAAVGYQNLSITDRGGFSGLSRTQPKFPTTPNGQTNLNLKQRATAAAWLNNFLTMAFYNATGPNPDNVTEINVQKGAVLKFPYPELCNNKSFTLQCPPGSFSFQWNSIQSSQDYGGYLNFFDIKEKPITVKNPYNISSQDFSKINQLCAGTTADSPLNINSSIVGCSLLYGAASPLDNGSPLVADPGSPWTIPIYSCATAVKASIRTVAFQFNGTGLTALNITSAAPKTYASPAGLPVWGVETAPRAMDFSTAQPLWGILGNSSTYSSSSSSYAKMDNFSTVNQPSLYLPGFMDDSLYPLSAGWAQSFTTITQNLPSLNFYSKALQNALGIISPIYQANSTQRMGGTDYSGYTSLALFAKWQNLSQSETSAKTIIDLVWTDYAANAVVGTRGWGLSTAESGRGDGTVPSENLQVTNTEVPVTVYRQVILYRMPFAVPAFIVLGALVAVLVVLLTLVARRKTGTKKMREMLEATSVGMIVAKAMWPEKMKQEDRTKSRFKMVRSKTVEIAECEILAPAAVGEEEALSPSNLKAHKEKTDGNTKVMSVSDVGKSQM